MKILMVATIMAAAANAGDVTVCMDPNSHKPEIRAAQGLASRLFARIGVTIDWRELRFCPAGGNPIQVSLSYDAPERQAPNAVAYALPYEGNHIVCSMTGSRCVQCVWPT
jgi:hypothetical protein